MSHAIGAVRFNDGKIAWFEYDGTADVVTTRLHWLRGDVDTNWRKDNDRDCKCGQPSEPVRIATVYGDGFHWAGEACRTCMAITDGFFPLDFCEGSDRKSYDPGLPEWWTGPC